MSKQSRSIQKTHLERSSIEEKLSIDLDDDFLNEEEKSQFSMNTKYEESLLYRVLEHKLDKNRNLSIESFESLISQLIEVSSCELNRKPPSFVCISKLHSALELEKARHFLTESEIEIIDQLLQTQEAKYGKLINKEYSQFKLFLKIVNGLLCKYSITRIENYIYRTKGRAVILKCIDLNKLNKNFFTMECLWYSTLMQQESLNSVLSLKTKQFALALQSQLLKTYKFILSFPIENNPAVLQHKSLWSWLFRSSSPVSDLKRHLVDLELAYRAFEKEFLENLLSQIYTNPQFAFPFY